MASYIYVIIMLNIKWIIEGSEINVARQALEYVFNVREGTCGAGTGDELPLQFDVTAWTEYADTAISGHEMFCPYAYKKNGTVRSHDLSLNYKYLDPDTEWYNSLKIKEWYHVNVVTDRITYREDDHQLPELKESYPIATLSDGHWTLPYFDCGGGNVWMVTYSSPIFRLEKGSILFRGVATIDIELTYMDINQCDGNKTDKSSGLDVFRGTHRCQSTTKCIHKKGKGFVSGAYSCECRKGYFFPDSNHPTQSYKGSEIESYLRRFGVIEPGMFQCSACTAGCVTCLNDSPCLHYHNTILSICLFSLTVMSVLGILTCAVFTYINRKNSVSITCRSSSLHRIS
ncbi:probable G-protein coupled receptor 158 [Mercenaria mercenaria]|uniref:probable G-protein coupled receptor 158 n=1 Tax=Mercenaria mercenaria TaxID=6596 RepID=UPI00234EA77A|nr:probable G-protein coupled receptor 158 [Mercenaria mercenaria]